jgi:large subunit ribosomal protein L1
MFSIAKQVCRKQGNGAMALITDQFNVASIRSRPYITRAHPKPTPEFSVNEALESILKDADLRKSKRNRRFKVIAKLKKIPYESPSHPDETIELAVNLNLDPRKPGQALRGSITLPNGSGKKVSCVVFTADDEIKDIALQAGALQAGGETLIDQIISGEIPVDSFQRAIATKEMMPILTKKAARLLGPRGLMPNAKVGTLLPESKDAKEPLLQLLETVLAGKEVMYRTEKEGIVHVPIGKASFGTEKLLGNIGQVMQTIFDVKPENYGKGRKGSNKAVGKGIKYLLRATVSSTQGKGMKLDLRTIDPDSAFFLTGVEQVSASSTEEENLELQELDTNVQTP